MNKPNCRGFSLIELVIFIVVVSVGVAGILLVMNTTVAASGDPIVNKQSIALAESVLEEVLLKEYSDPDGSNAGETGRDTWDDVSDYDTKTEADLALPTEVSAYTVQIAVVSDTTVVGTGSRPAKKVSVTVSKGGNSITLHGYRSNY